MGNPETGLFKPATVPDDSPRTLNQTISMLQNSGCMVVYYSKEYASGYEQVSYEVFIQKAGAARIMGFNPERIDHIRWADESGLGTMNPEVVGDTIESVKRVFDRGR